MFSDIYLGELLGYIIIFYDFHPSILLFNSFTNMMCIGQDHKNNNNPSIWIINTYIIESVNNLLRVISFRLLVGLAQALIQASILVNSHPAFIFKMP